MIQFTQKKLLFIHLNHFIKVYSPKFLLLAIFWRFQHHTILDPCGTHVTELRQLLSSLLASFLEKTQYNKVTEIVSLKVIFF